MTMRILTKFCPPNLKGLYMISNDQEVSEEVLENGNRWVDAGVIGIL